MFDTINDHVFVVVVFDIEKNSIYHTFWKQQKKLEEKSIVASI